MSLMTVRLCETEMGHTKLCIGLQGFACFSKMGRVSAVVMGKLLLAQVVPGTSKP